MAFPHHSWDDVCLGPAGKWLLRKKVKMDPIELIKLHAAAAVRYFVGHGHSVKGRLLHTVTMVS